jgi:hypothetical protein
LRLSQNHNSNISYCALSYRWGGAKDILVLKRENIVDFENGIPLEDLPETIQDAIRVTHSLAQRFLWVDSLCIIQDCKDDWAVESRQMCAIYQSALCTIAAEGAQNSKEGIFVTRNPLGYLPCALLSDDSKSIVVKTSEYQNRIISKVPNLSQRGWCFQERVASKRLLVFGKRGLFWACSQGEADEWDIEGKGTKKRPLPLDDPKVTMEGKKLFGPTVQVADWKPARLPVGDVSNGKTDYLTLTDTSTLGSLIDPHRAHQLWFGLVSPYSTTKLTNGSDKLVALAGLARRVQLARNYQYLAGLWQQTLSFDLLWTLKYDSKAGRPPYQAPTWSWASVNGTITSWMHTSYDLSQNTILYRLESFDIRTQDITDIHQIGALVSASLTLTGKFRHIPSQCLTIVEKEKDIFFKSSQTLTLNNSYLGQLRPDIESPSFDNVYLFPIVLATRLPSFRTIQRPQSASLTAQTFNRISDAKYCMCGLDLIKRIDGEVHFERIGFFHFDFSSVDDVAATWFEDTEEQKIVIF